MRMDTDGPKRLARQGYFRNKPRLEGGPSKLTEGRMELILTALRAGATRERAAQLAGIARSTLYLWLKRDAVGTAVRRPSRDVGKGRRGGHPRGG